MKSHQHQNFINVEDQQTIIKFNENCNQSQNERESMSSSKNQEYNHHTDQLLDNDQCENLHFYETSTISKNHENVIMRTVKFNNEEST